MKDSRQYRVIRTTSRDNVAIAVRLIPKGAVIFVSGDPEICLITNEQIPSGHKVSLDDIDTGQAVIRYGETIGLATQDIKKGDWVHIHNMALP